MKDAVLTFEEFKKPEIEGRISWGSFMSAHANAILLLTGSFLFAIWSLTGNFRGRFVAAGFSLLVATSSLLSLAIHMLGIVTRFRLTPSGR